MVVVSAARCSFCRAQIARAAFVMAGLAPTHPTHSPKLGRSSPDLISENGVGRYAVEIKDRNIRRMLEANDLTKDATN